MQSTKGNCCKIYSAANLIIALMDRLKRFFLEEWICLFSCKNLKLLGKVEVSRGENEDQISGGQTP